jgi:hypothetical protein
LLIVVAIILIIAAIAIPLLRARIAANEASAVSSMDHRQRRGHLSVSPTVGMSTLANSGRAALAHAPVPQAAAA